MAKLLATVDSDGTHCSAGAGSLQCRHLRHMRGQAFCYLFDYALSSDDRGPLCCDPCAKGQQAANNLPQATNNGGPNDHN